MTFVAKRLPIILPLFTMCAITVLAIEKPKTQPIGGKVKWIYNYEEGKRLSQSTGKPMFVVFRCER